MKKKFLVNEALKNADLFLGKTKLVSKKYLKFDYNKFNEEELKKILKSIGFDIKKDKLAILSTYSENYTRTEYLKQLFKKTNIKAEYYIYPKRYVKFFQNLMRIKNKYKFFFVSFRSQETLPAIRKIVGKDKKIIFDAFVSMYDTLCEDRKIINGKSLLGKTIKWYDNKLGKLSDVVLVDTKTHADYFRKELKIKNIKYLYVGCDTNIFKKIKVQRENKLIIFWYGYANPLQGVGNILRWAKSLENKNNIKFILGGPIRKKYGKLIKELKLNNVELIDFIKYDDLPKYMNKADLCLGGHFSEIPKAKRVIAGKTFQMIECCDNVLISSNHANKELFK